MINFINDMLGFVMSMCFALNFLFIAILNWITSGWGWKVYIFGIPGLIALLVFVSFIRKAKRRRKQKDSAD